MSDDENDPSPGSSSPKRSGSALHVSPHRKVALSNPLVLHGWHFGQTVFALCNYPSLLTGGILRLEELQDSCIEDYPAEVFMELVDTYPSLLECLMAGEEEDVIHVGELVSDNTKTLKSAILEWLSDCGFNHEVTGALLCPADLDWSNPDPQTKQGLKSGRIVVHGDQWPMFLYSGHIYDPEAPWQGLLRSEILVCGFKYVLTSPSSMEKDPKATHSGNAYLHGMKLVTKGSLAYIATQVQFSLSSSSVFSCTDTVIDLEKIYHSILDLLEDPDEIEVADLMTWWTCHIFPDSSSSQRSISKNSMLSKIWEKCAAPCARANASTN
ncbi:hypothetical protein BDR03DRAFT_935218 [Suillus americanus]|nr:hypothetical protein BDR03DRAFT_935218 [Suillus americanus]